MTTIERLKAEHDREKVIQYASIVRKFAPIEAKTKKGKEIAKAVSERIAQLADWIDEQAKSL